jgi:dolichol-phosphate mannosyltransferase
MMAADSPKDARKQLSVIVPTYEEAANVAPLCERLFAATRKAGLVVELLLVDDDSGAGTVATRAAVERMAELGYAIKLHVRQRHEGKGLSSAVLLGLRLAQYDTLLVMDADLQHEPESVPAVAAPVLDRTADFAVGSRNVAGAAVAEGWPLVRRVISSGATLLARPLTTCSDPMSGFFCLSREALARAEKVRPRRSARAAATCRFARAARPPTSERGVVALRRARAYHLALRRCRRAPLPPSGSRVEARRRASAPPRSCSAPPPAPRSPFLRLIPPPSPPAPPSPLAPPNLRPGRVTARACRPCPTRWATRLVSSSWSARNARPSSRYRSPSETGESTRAPLPRGRGLRAR